MSASPPVVDSDFRYLDGKGNLMRSRTELSVARMLSFLGVEYEYDVAVCADPGIRVDFRTGDGRLIEVIDGEGDVAKYEAARERLPGRRIMAVGRPRHAARAGELREVAFYDEAPRTGSIFLEDPSFAFDYAHVLPLVEKCSILHGHTSSIMVELVGRMRDGLLVDFGEAKRIIRGAVASFDHKFFVNERYLLPGGDGSHHRVGFEGPRGAFDLRVPKHTTYLLRGEATVENLAAELIKILSPKMPANVEAVGVYIYEGYNKGSHIISSIPRG